MNWKKKKISRHLIEDNQEFIPLLLGGDINTYSMARAFYEQYQVKSYIIGKFPTGPSCNSRIIEYQANPLIDTDEHFLQIVNAFAKKHSHKKILLIGCGDNYVARISQYDTKKNPKDASQSNSSNTKPAGSETTLAPNILAPITNYELMRRLQNKETFYQLCNEQGINYPLTFIYKSAMKTDFELPFSFPVILKPSDGISYWEHPFAGQNKVYQIQDRQELERVIQEIYQAGYEDTLIIQDLIPGNDEYMRVLTSYSDQKGTVKMMCLGHVLLEEHTPHGKGNHAVILTEQNEVLLQQAKNFLETIHYTGFSNFDIKYDKRDKTYKFLEINTRQGRSNYYVTNSGLNMAKYPVEEYIYKRELEFEQSKEEYLWLVVPKKVAFRYIKEKENIDKMRQMFQEKRKINPLFLHGDLKPKRFLAMVKNYMSHFVKYKKYYK